MFRQVVIHTKIGGQVNQTDNMLSGHHFNGRRGTVRSELVILIVLCIVQIWQTTPLGVDARKSPHVSRRVTESG